MQLNQRKATLLSTYFHGIHLALSLVMPRSLRRISKMVILKALTISANCSFLDGYHRRRLLQLFCLISGVTTSMLLYGLGLSLSKSLPWLDKLRLWTLYGFSWVRVAKNKLLLVHYGRSWVSLFGKEVYSRFQKLLFLI